MNQRQKQKLDTRETIIRVAMNEFAKNGILETSTLTIAKKAKVSHGSIFAHFSNREELLTEVIGKFSEKVCNRTHILATKDEGFEAILNAHILALQEFENFYIRILSESSNLPHKIKCLLICIQSVISCHIMQAAKKEIAVKKIKDLPPYFIFNIWIGLIHHYLLNHDFFSPGKSVLKRYKKELINNFMNIIVVEKGR